MVKSLGLKNFVAGTFSELIKLGGEKVSRIQAADRIAVCAGCKYAGEVEPLPMLKMEGCTLCGCPFKTKPYFKKIIVPGLEEEIKCPHPEGNKWAEIDKKYKAIKK